MSTLDPTQDEIDAAKMRVQQLMPTIISALARIFPLLKELVASGTSLSADVWAEADPEAREEYEMLKALYYAAETAKGADE